MELSAILGFISTIMVIIGIIFGLIQLRHYHLARKREAALLLLNSFSTADFFQGIWIIQGLPQGLGKNAIEGRLGDETRTIYLVMSNWESIGILLYNHEIDLDLVDYAYSDQIIVSWYKLEKYVTDLRNELERETLFEWFQWLAEQMMDREKADHTFLPTSLIVIGRK